MFSHLSELRIPTGLRTLRTLLDALKGRELEEHLAEEQWASDICMSAVSETPTPGDFSTDIVSQADWICKVYANLRRTPKFCQLPTEDLKLLSKMQVKVTSVPKIPKFHRSLQFLTVHLSLWPWLGLGTCNSVVKCSNNFCALTLVSSTCFKPQEVFQYQIDFQISFRPNEAKQI